MLSTKEKNYRDCIFWAVPGEINSSCSSAVLDMRGHERTCENRQPVTKGWFVNQDSHGLLLTVLLLHLHMPTNLAHSFSEVTYSKSLWLEKQKVESK